MPALKRTHDCCCVWRTIGQVAVSAGTSMRTLPLATLRSFIFPPSSLPSRSRTSLPAVDVCGSLRDGVVVCMPRTCPQVARVRSIMCSYNAGWLLRCGVLFSERRLTRVLWAAVNGIPACGNGDFNNAVLRDEWGWDGMIVSDYTAVELMGE